MRGIHGDKYPIDILRFAQSRSKIEWTYVITGRTGPTGKTHLCNLLRQDGYRAVELSENINLLVDYNDRENHIFVDERQKCVIIVFNRILEKYADRWE